MNTYRRFQTWFPNVYSRQQNNAERVTNERRANSLFLRYVQGWFTPFPQFPGGTE
jgi:hypothetical protein